MRRLYIFASIIILAAVSASAQISKIFDKYEDTNGVTMVYVSGKMIGKKSDNINLNGISISSDKIDFVRTLSTETVKLISNLNTDIKDAISRMTDYTQLVKVSNGDNKTDIYIIKGSDKKKEYVIYNHSPKSICLIQVVGSLSTDDVIINAPSVTIN